MKGFQPLRQAVPRTPRLVLNVQGLPKCGKTRFALTAPAPIALLNFDDGLEGTAEAFMDKDVRVFNAAALSGDFKARWEAFVAAYRDALNDKAVRSVVVDTGTLAWELLRMARLGKLTKVMPVQYVQCNQEMTELVRAAYRTDKNVVWVHEEKEEYVKDKWTGAYVMAGFSRMGYGVQATVRMARDPEAEGLEAFGLEILECRHDAECNGTELPGAMATFAAVASIIMPHAPAEAWA